MTSEADLSVGVSVEELTDEVSKKFTSQQKTFSGFSRFQPYNQVMPTVYAKYDREIKEFECRDDDVWVASFPKCGKSY